MKCWGYNDRDEIGNPDAPRYVLTPMSVVGTDGVGTLNNITDITAGSEQTCALLQDNTMKCWGQNSTGQLGNGTTTNSPIPVAVEGLSGPVLKLSSGSTSNTSSAIVGNR